MKIALVERHLDGWAQQMRQVIGFSLERWVFAIENWKNPCPIKFLQYAALFQILPNDFFIDNLLAQLKSVRCQVKLQSRKNMFIVMFIRNTQGQPGLIKGSSW